MPSDLSADSGPARAALSAVALAVALAVATQAESAGTGKLAPRKPLAALAQEFPSAR